jgi:hypothetical protein
LAGLPIFVWGIIGGAVVLILVILIVVCVVRGRSDNDYAVGFFLVTLNVIRFDVTFLTIGIVGVLSKHVRNSVAGGRHWTRAQHRMDSRYKSLHTRRL